jgi:hypothetical protein
VAVSCGGPRCDWFGLGCWGFSGESPARPLVLADNGDVVGSTFLVGDIVVRPLLPYRSLVEKPGFSFQHCRHLRMSLPSLEALLWKSTLPTSLRRLC